MQVNFLTQLAALKTKDELHRWVNELPDDVELKGLIFMDISGAAGNDEEYHFAYRSIGHPSDMEKNFYIDVYKNNVIFGCGGDTEP